MKRNKPFIIIGSIILGLGLIIIAGGSFISKKIEKELQNQQIGSYRIHSSDTDVNILMRRLTLSDADIKNFETEDHISISRIVVGGIHIFSLLFRDELIINKLTIHSPEITLNKDASKEKEVRKEEPDDEVDVGFELIVIRKMEIHDGSFILQNRGEKKSDTLLSFDAGLELWNLNIGSQNERYTYHEHSAERLKVSVHNSVIKIPGDLYHLEIESLTFDTWHEALHLENLHLSTLHPKQETSKAMGVETDWYDIRLQQLKVEGINLDALILDTAIVFRKATIEEMNAHIFRDKRPPFPEKPDTQLPMGMLENLPVLFHSDSILITSSQVIYEEFGEESSDPGMVTFEKLYATIYNLSTLSDSIKGQTAMSARAMVMNESLLEAEFIFPNYEHSYRYRVTGNLAPVNLAAFNSMTVPSAFVRIDEGQLRNLNFEFTYDTESSEGKLTMEYENLDISLLDDEDGSTKKFKTFLTETFVLNKSNLKENNSYQEGTISFERDKKKSIFNYWWKSLFSGIQDILAF